jgi:hypothetical protein
MTYSVGGIVQAADYNTFQTNLNTIWSTGSTDNGWGQTALSAVSPTGVVTATNWASLVNTLATAGSQTTTTLTSRTAPVAGNVVAILSNVTTDIASVTARRGYATSSGTTSSTFSGAISKTTPTGNPGSTSSWTTGFLSTIFFPSADQARYFWNAGGLIRLDMSKTSTGKDLDEDWNNFVGTVGVLYISGRVNNANQVIAGTTYTGFTRIGGSGTPSTFLTTTGYYSLTLGGSYTTVFQLYNSVSPYIGQMNISVGLQRVNSQSFNVFTTWQQSFLATTVTEISGGTATTSPFSGTFGTAPTVLCRFIPPSTAQGLTNTWGTPTVSSSVS